jgi:hypothetical protein
MLNAFFESMIFVVLLNYNTSIVCSLNPFLINNCLTASL